MWVKVQHRPCLHPHKVKGGAWPATHNAHRLREAEYNGQLWRVTLIDLSAAGVTACKACWRVSVCCDAVMEVLKRPKGATKETLTTAACCWRFCQSPHPPCQRPGSAAPTATGLAAVAAAVAPQAAAAPPAVALLLLLLLLLSWRLQRHCRCRLAAAAVAGLGPTLVHLPLGHMPHAHADLGRPAAATRLLLLLPPVLCTAPMGPATALPQPCTQHSRTRHMPAEEHIPYTDTTDTERAACNNQLKNGTQDSTRLHCLLASSPVWCTSSAQVVDGEGCLRPRLVHKQLQQGLLIRHG
jgi:hypothetical protein